MRKSRWKSWCLGATLVLVSCGTGDAVLKSRGPAGSGDSNTARPRPSIPDAGTVHSYRGHAGTLGVLTAASLVIPAGIISILYLLYIHYCQSGDGDADEMVSGGKYEWSDINPNDVMLVNDLWSKPGEALEEDGELSAPLLGAAPSQGSQDGVERLTPINGKGSSEDAARDTGGIAPTNGLDGDAITPQQDATAETGEAPVVEADPNEDLTNVVEVHVTAGDLRGVKAANHGGLEEKRPVLSRQTPARFREAVNLRVVNQVQVELMLTDLGVCDSAPPTANEGQDKYVSEMQVYLPGVGGIPEDDTRGRCSGVDANA